MEVKKAEWQPIDSFFFLFKVFWKRREKLKNEMVGGGLGKETGSRGRERGRAGRREGDG